MHDLLFLNPVLNKGVNVTVRRGTKWADKAVVGDEVLIFETGKMDHCFGKAEIIGLACLPCNMIPAEWLMLEHDATCKTQHGLEKAMKRAYPNFKSDDIVTVLLFELD